MAAREQRISEMLEALRAGNAEPLGKLRSEPPEKAASEARAALAPWQQRLGAWQSAQVLGNGSYGGHPYTYARLTFARGPKIAEYLWSGMGIEAVHFMDAPRRSSSSPSRTAPSPTSTCAPGGSCTSASRAQTWWRRA
jgi:hypothetical protein